MTRFPLRRLLTASLFSLFAGTALADTSTAWRLFVSDHAAPEVRAIDLGSGVVDTFVVKGPATLHRTASGRTVFAVQGDAGAVTGIATGISFEDHGEHGDLHVEAPKLLGVEVAGGKPSHFVEHDGAIALFFDGEGVTRNLSENAALEGRAEFKEVRTAAPHHGVAVAWGEHVLLSEPNIVDPDELPVGIQVVEENGAKVGGVHACPDLHGEASSGDLLAFACATGLLIVRNGEGGLLAVRHLAYGESLPEGKATTLIGGRGLQYLLGNYGPDKLVVIDPAAENAFRLVELPTRRVHFAADPVRSRFAYVMTEDGQLHRLDVLSGRIDKSMKLTEPYSMDGHWSDPRPRIAVAGDAIAVTDPLKGVVRLVDAASFEPRSEIAVEGKPFSIVAVGGSGATH